MLNTLVRNLSYYYVNIIAWWIYFFLAPIPTLMEWSIKRIQT